MLVPFFLFPGYGVTMKNVEEAIIAAKERAQHLNKIKEKKIVNLKIYIYQLNKSLSQ